MTKIFLLQKVAFENDLWFLVYFLFIKLIKNETECISLNK